MRCKQGWAQRVASALHPDARLEPVPELFEATALAALAAVELAVSPAFKRDAVTAFKVRSPIGAPLGMVIQTHIDSIEPNLVTWWVVGADGEVLDIVSSSGRPIPPEVTATRGLSARQAKDCSGLAELAALELSVLSRHHLSAAPP